MIPVSGTKFEAGLVFYRPAFFIFPRETMFSSSLAFVQVCHDPAESGGISGGIGFQFGGTFKELSHLPNERSLFSLGQTGHKWGHRASKPGGMFDLFGVGAPRNNKTRHMARLHNPLDTAPETSGRSPPNSPSAKGRREYLSNHPPKTRLHCSPSFSVRSSACAASQSGSSGYSG
jgi:hypothetical protein